MRGVILSTLVSALASLAGGDPDAALSRSMPSAGYGVAPATASACRTVTKKVRGKRRRVRVCSRPRPRPRRLDVSVGLDGRRTSAFTLTPAGGSLVLGSADGATLTLSVPAGATNADVTVRATPVSSIRGLPLRSLVAGVQLEPDGLQLAQPATLTIEPPRVPTGRLFGFAYEGNGRKLVPYRVARDGEALSFTITHFSGYGAGTGTDATRQALLGPMLAEAGALQVELTAAAHNPSLLAYGNVLDRYMAWKAAALAYGMPEAAAYRSSLAVTAHRAVEGAIAFARLRCRDPLRRELKPSFDVFRALQRALSLGLGELVRGPPSVVLEECLRFELDAEFRLTFHREARDKADFWSDDAVIEVKAEKVPIALPGRLEGSGPLRIATWDYTYSAHYEQNLRPDPPVECSGHELSAAPGEPLGVALELDAARSAPVGTPETTLVLDVGDVDAEARIECPPPLQGLSGTIGVGYAESWTAFADKLQRDGRFRIDVLPPFGNQIGGAVWATYGPETRTYEYSFPGGVVRGTLTWSFVLRHVPQA